MRKTFEDVDKALKPYDAELQKHNVSRGQIVERLLAERGEMMKDPSGFIKRFADMNRISLHDLASDPELNEPPEVRQARWQLRDQQSQIEAQRQGIAEQQRQIELGQLTDYVNNWGAAKPHFAEVRQAMAQIIPEIQQSYPYLSFEEQLETAYGAALRHPSFASLRKPQPVPQSVRRAASGVSGISGAPTRTKEPANIREALMQAAKETGYF
jgi:ADP-ribosylglycohydrolase